MTTEEEGRITQGTIAQFMRKRTQLVGFEFGYWKHAQYAAEFLDNALDAIETFQWSELKKEDSSIAYTLDQEIFLENFSVLQKEVEEEDSHELDDEAKRTLLGEIRPQSKSILEEKPKGEKPKKEEPKPKKKEEIEEIEVKNLIRDMESLIAPVNNIKIIDKEPIVIMRLTESEAHSLLTGEIDAKNVMSYKFEVFDNGLGMAKVDVEKYGKYLASSKSIELKQTRGSQGFGAPSAFSDSQNTTGKPIVAVSKTADNLYATASEFFTTSKNEKRYVVHPTEIDVPFLHGTYIKLNYLNIKYVRGYVDTYVKETALMNPHVTIIYIDPYDEEYIFPRKVSSFPAEPKYAKPHPSSTNIGDLQDLLGKSEHLSLTSFLQDNFVRMSYNTAKEVVELAERDLQDKLNLLILDTGFLKKVKKKSDDIYFLRYEKRVYGRSSRPRDKLIVYEVKSDEIKEQYWNEIEKYQDLNDEIDEITDKIKKFKTKIQKADTKKEQRKIKRDVRKLRRKIDAIRDDKDSLRANLNKIFKDQKTGLEEIKTKKKVRDFEDLVEEVKISDARPQDLTNDQFNSLFFAFKSVKYMSPPTDTVVPIGNVVLENTLIKELGLKVSENLDDFGTPVEDLKTSTRSALKRKKQRLLGENPEISEEDLENTELTDKELIEFNSKILSQFLLENDNFEPEGYSQDLHSLLELSETSEEIDYKQVFEYFVENFTREDDFVAAETRDPTSGKGLAYIVEGVLAYANKLEVPKRSRDVLSRFVNRTPKLRDTADCAITKAVQAVNWKNYNLDSFDNGLPKGPIKLLVNVSGFYVHLMFKSQSKNALADDEDLINEIKYCLEAIGRRLRVYLNRRAKIRKKEKRANLIEKYIPKFVSSLYNIAQEGSNYKDEISKEELEKLMKTPIRKERPQISEDLREKISKKRKIKKEREKEIIDVENLEDYTVKELKGIADKKDVDLPSRARKAEIIETIQIAVGVKEKEKEKEKVVEKPQKITKEKRKKKVKAPPMPSKTRQQKLPVITNEAILEALEENKWQNIQDLIFKMRIKDMLDARLLQVKLKELERKEKVVVKSNKGKKFWKLN
jgi:DNA topoisomerase VI B subunit